jgi:hypothetical protein
MRKSVLERMPGYMRYLPTATEHCDAAIEGKNDSPATEMQVTAKNTCTHSLEQQTLC